MIVIFSFYYFLIIKNIYQDELVVRNGEVTKVLYIQKVESEEDRQKGLGGRWKMCNECGMLFIFEESRELGFWMKGMKFDIDIIFIDENKKVTLIYEEVKRESYPRVYEGVGKYVLELNAGAAKDLGIEEGDVLEW